MCATDCDECANRCLVILVGIIIGFCYICYICMLAIPLGYFTSATGLFNLLFLHTALGLLLLSYIRTVQTSPGYVPKDWIPPNATKEEMEEAKSIKDDPKAKARSHEFGRLRYCHNCNSFKPPRAHHCRECSRCVMKMDHHCPWVNNCVGFKNHKTFILFLFYAVVALSWFLFHMCWRLVDIFRNRTTSSEDDMVLSPFELIFFILNFILTLPITLAILSLFIYQVSLIRENLTSIEVFHKRRYKREASRAGKKNYRWPYDFGASYNFQSMFGESFSEWFVPNLSYQTDGITWRTRDSDGISTGTHELVQVVEADDRKANSGNLNKRSSHHST
eukprot:TRINITY_DN1013_c0_g1_i1.p1 TRINITY_DN1013_c0_g1~~TRINITY_DN1013_c0_g1_i1.p1  ORF type:complete len:344 (+),score=19.66 TRINITY_DN1013_c0_g1_i1:36-1034(+)